MKNYPEYNFRYNNILYKKYRRRKIYYEITKHGRL